MECLFSIIINYIFVNSKPRPLNQYEDGEFSLNPYGSLLDEELLTTVAGIFNGAQRAFTNHTLQDTANLTRRALWEIGLYTHVPGRKRSSHPASPKAINHLLDLDTDRRLFGLSSQPAKAVHSRLLCDRVSTAVVNESNFRNIHLRLHCVNKKAGD